MGISGRGGQDAARAIGLYREYSCPRVQVRIVLVDDVCAPRMSSTCSGSQRVRMALLLKLEGKTKVDLSSREPSPTISTILPR